MSFTLIETEEDLSLLNKELMEKPYIGVDTEFRRTTKDNMRLALLQINDGEEIYLIDPINLKSPQKEVEFLFSNSVIKIFHSCKEDLEAIFSWTHREMVNIFDTQIANSFLDGDFSIGYQGLVEKNLGVILNKSETRSNWIRRPLSDSQLDYAASDVEYLIYIYLDQKKELENNNKIDWHNQEIARLLKITFNSSSIYSDLERTITKAQESDLLSKFNIIVEKISKREKINPTLFFSKKAQKDFLRLVFKQGLDLACEEITLWRVQLIKEDILDLLK